MYLCLFVWPNSIRKLNNLSTVVQILSYAYMYILKFAQTYNRNYIITPFYCTYQAIRQMSVTI